jgi:hypothetical protein
VVRPKGKLFKQFLKKLIVIWFINPTSGYIPKRSKRTNLARYFTTNTHSSIIPNVPKVNAADELINKMWYVHTMKYYSVLKKEILAQCKMNDLWVFHCHKKINIVWFYLYKIPKIVTFIESESSIWEERRHGSLYLFIFCGVEFMFTWIQSFSLDRWKSSGDSY